MKQVNLTITFDEEKLSALKRYMGKKELDLDREMTDALVKLYEKYVKPSTGMDAVKLPSTSPANAAWSLEQLIECWKGYIK